jgi:TonB family protein
MPAPAPIAPPDESTFTNYPRTVHFRWSGIPQASTYTIEIDCLDCCVKGRWCSEAQGAGYVVADLKKPEYGFDFWGNQKGRWRVWAVDAQSQPGFKSAWSGFAFVGVPRPGPTSTPPPADTPSPPSTPSEEVVLSYGPGITPAKTIFAPQPEYTEAARKTKIQGEVLMLVTVGTDGTARDIRILRSLDPSLDINAVEALKRWKFEPAKKDGRPVAMRLQISMSFSLL